MEYNKVLWKEKQTSAVVQVDCVLEEHSITAMGSALIVRCLTRKGAHTEMKVKSIEDTHIKKINILKTESRIPEYEC